MDDQMNATLTPAEGASLLMVTPIEFRRLSKAGWFSSVGRNRYRAVDVVQGFIRSLHAKGGSGRRLGTMADAARACDVSERRFRELVDANVFERKAPGQYDLDQVTLTMIRHQRKAASGRGDGLDLSAERAGLAKAQAEAARFRNDALAGKYVAVDIVGKVLTANILVFRELCLAWPGQNADRLALGDPVLRQRLLEGLGSGMNELLGSVAEVGEMVERARDQTMARSTRRSRA